jgi:hypothetical protein
MLKVQYGLFGSVVVVVFQSVFHSEMHQNDIFFKKILFLRSAHQNDPKHIKKLNFLETRVGPRFQTLPCS